jgi:hypothetical protein
MSSVSNLVSPWSPVVQEIRRIRDLPVLQRASRALALMKGHSPELLAEAARHARVSFWNAIVAKAQQIQEGAPAEEILMEAVEAFRGEHSTVEELAALPRPELLLTIRAMYRKHRLLDPTGEGTGIWLAFVDRVHKAFDPDGLCHSNGIRAEFFWYTYGLESVRVGMFLNDLFNDAQELCDYEGIRRGSPEWIKIVEGDPGELAAHEAAKAAALASAPEIATKSFDEIVALIFRGSLGDPECEVRALSAVDPMTLTFIREKVKDMEAQQKREQEEEDYHERLEHRYGSCGY